MEIHPTEQHNLETLAECRQLLEQLTPARGNLKLLHSVRNVLKNAVQIQYYPNESRKAKFRLETCRKN